MQINRYTREVIKARPVANQVDLSAIDRAGSGFRQAAEIADVANAYVERERQAINATKLNKSMLDYQKDLMLESERLQQENMATPEGFATMFEERSKEIARQYEESFSDRDVKRAFADNVGNIQLKYFNQNLNWQRDRNVTLAAERLEDAAQSINTMAFRGGDINELFKEAEASAVAGSTFLAPEVVENQLETMKRGIVLSRLDGMVDKGQVGQAKALLDSKKYDDYLGAEGLSRAYKAIETKRKQIESEFKAAETKTLKQEYSNFNDAFSLGVIPSQEVVTQMKDRARSLGMDDVVKDIDMKLNTHGTVNTFVKDLPIAEQQQALASKMESLRANPSEENIFEYKALAKAYENKVNQIQSGNGMAYYESIGLIPKQEPIDVTQPNNVVQVYEQRRVAQQAILQREGVTVPLFSKAEAQGMAQFYEQLPVKDRRNYITAITANLDKNEASQLAGVVAAEQPALAGILALSKENPRLAEKAIKGSMLENKISSKRDVYSRMVQTIGSAVDDPRALNSSMDVIRDAYEQSLVENGKQVDDFDLLDEVIEDAFGEIVSFGNSNVLPFRKDDGQFVEPLEFQKMVNDLNVNLIQNRTQSIPYIGGRPITDEELNEALFSWEMVTVGDGKYQLRNGNDVLVDEKGAPFVFDMKHLTQGMVTESLFSRGFRMLSGSASRSIQPLAEE